MGVLITEVCVWVMRTPGLSCLELRPCPALVEGDDGGDVGV